MSIGEEIRREIAQRQQRTVEVVHPEVPAYTVIYRVPTDKTEVDELARRATAAKNGGNFDASLLAACCERIFRFGELVADDDGSPLTFRDRKLQEWLDVTSARDAARKLYGSDGYVTSIARRLADEAGYGASDEVMVDDPTLPS